MSAFVGFTIDGETKLVSVDTDGLPSRLGVQVVQYARELVPGITAETVRRLQLVDEDEEVDAAWVEERHPDLFRVHGRQPTATTWADWIAPFTSIGSLIAYGIASDASHWADQSWGYLIDLDAGTLAVFQRALTAPAGYSGPVLLDGMYRIVDFYVRALPSDEMFLEAVADEKIR